MKNGRAGPGWVWPLFNRRSPFLDWRDVNSKTDDCLLNKTCFQLLWRERSVKGQVRAAIEVQTCAQKANKPKTNSASQLAVYIFEKRRAQSISDVNIRLHPFSCTRFSANEICAWLPSYRFQRGPNLPLEIRQLSLSYILPSLSSSFSTLPFSSLLRKHTHKHSSCHERRRRALAMVSSGGCSGREILQGKLFSAVSEVVRCD